MQAPCGTAFVIIAFVIVGNPPPPEVIVNVRSTYGTSVIMLE